MEYTVEFFQKSADYVLSIIKEKPEIAIILGSGLGDFASKIENPIEIAYEDIPNFLVSTVSSHAGKLIYGKGNNDKDQTEGAKYKNVIFTNALGPVFVKNPWYTEKIINEALKAKGCEPCEPLDESFFEIERNSFKTVRRFIDQKTEK